MDERRLISVKETAVLLGCCEANVYSLMQIGDLPFVCVGRRKGYRIDRRDIEAFLEARKQQKTAVSADYRRPRPRLKHIRL